MGPHSASSATGAGTSSDEALIAELAALPPLNYAKRREAAAEQIGISVSSLDRLVKAEQSKSDEVEPADDLYLYSHWAVEPWDEPVEGEVLLKALIACVRRYVVVTDDQAVAIALWIVFTWLHEHERFATHSPILLVRSPEKDSGKTTLLNLTSFLARRALTSVEISGAALFRSIEKWQPTFVIDEADEILVNNADLRSVVNSGWTRGQTVIRCHPDTHEPEAFSTFAPKALGVKGDQLPDTTLSRAITIDMKPKLSDEPIADFDHLDNADFAKLRRQLLRWASDNAEALTEITPEIPEGFYNRRRANWRPLLAIAEQAACKKAAHNAAREIEKQQAAGEPSAGLQLLGDIRDLFDTMNTDRITTDNLLSKLTEDEDGRWKTYNRGKPITSRQVSRLLKQYKIAPRNIRPVGAGATRKGYQQNWFQDAFKRYLTQGDPKPGDLSGAPAQTSNINGLDAQSDPAQSPFVPDGISAQPIENVDLCRCAGSEGPFSAPSAKNADQDPPEDRTCAQCRGPVDGKEQAYSINDKSIWLHPECMRFYPGRQP